MAAGTYTGDTLDPAIGRFSAAINVRVSYRTRFALSAEDGCPSGKLNHHRIIPLARV